MGRESILTDVRYAMTQLVGCSAGSTRAACVDRASRALDALERVEAALEPQLGEQSWTTEEILAREG
jgi:hypothetical protein